MNEALSKHWGPVFVDERPRFYGASIVDGLAAGVVAATILVALDVALGAGAPAALAAHALLAVTGAVLVAAVAVDRLGPSWIAGTGAVVGALVWAHAVFVARPALGDAVGPGPMVAALLAVHVVVFGLVATWLDARATEGTA